MFFIQIYWSTCVNGTIWEKISKEDKGMPIPNYSKGINEAKGVNGDSRINGI